jgi:hypothetical protein
LEHRIRVAVIDSGVHAAHPHIGRVAGGFPAGDFVDRLGHGTAVMAAIQEKAPEADCFAVRVFHRELRASMADIVAAMEWAVEQRMDLINMSLGTANAAHAETFAPFLDRAVFVSAAGMWPGNMAGVIRVAPDAALARDAYRIEGETFYASPYPRPIDGVPRERNLNGASFAVANMTGLVARACADAGRLSYEVVLRVLRDK